MKLKSFNEKYEKKIKKIDKKPKKMIDFKWILTITLCAFILSIFFSSVTEVLVSKLSIFIGILLILLIIIVGVLFDMIGIAITACNIKSFNSMAAKKIKGSKTAIFLIHNAEKVSAFCNDVIGDVCGIISGSLGILIATSLSLKYSLNTAAMTLLLTAVIAALTIGGKAMGKSFAINKSDVIVFKFSKFISLFKWEGK